jgi:hypothetical protein
METVTGAGAPRLRFPPVHDAHAASLPARRRCQTAAAAQSWHGKQGQKHLSTSSYMRILSCVLTDSRPLRTLESRTP